MNLLSKNTLDCYTRISSDSKVNVIVKGELLLESINASINMDLTMQFQYSDNATGDILEVGTRVVTEAEQQALYQAVKGSLPDINVDYSAWYLQLLYESFRVEMAATFGIPTNEISIV